MDNIQGMFSGHALRDINAVRMYLQVTMVSQISSSNGSNIGTSLRLHHIPFDNQSHPMDWPNQPKPSPRAWCRWDSAIATLSADGKLLQPLGDWLLATTSSWKFFTSPHLPNLLLQRSQKGWTSHKKTNGSYWVHFARKGSPIPPPTDISPTQTTTTPFFIVTEGNTNGNPPLPPLPPPPPWDLPLSQHNRPLSQDWDLHVHLESPGSSITLSTDGGALPHIGYFGWAIASEFDILWQGIGAIPAHSTQLNSLRPESMSYLSSLMFLRDYISSHKTVVSSSIRHIVDNHSVVSRMEYYNSQQNKHPSFMVRSDMDVQLPIEDTLQEI